MIIVINRKTRFCLNLYILNKPNIVQGLSGKYPTVLIFRIAGYFSMLLVQFFFIKNKTLPHTVVLDFGSDLHPKKLAVFLWKAFQPMSKI